MKNENKRWLLRCCFVAVMFMLVPVLFAGCKKDEVKVFVINSAGASFKFIAEIADSDDERMRGLMYRESLDPDRGMLFVFERAARQGFWMRNTLIPLDMLFVDENKVITDINHSAKPGDLSSFVSSGPVLYVLEINGGFCKKNNIKVGDRLEFKL